MYLWSETEGLFRDSVKGCLASLAIWLHYETQLNR